MRLVLRRCWQIVSERTGYPVDMLEPDLDLEADLSIDSIKRIEIVGELAERLGLGAGGGARRRAAVEAAGRGQDATRASSSGLERSSIERQAAADPRSADRSGVGRTRHRRVPRPGTGGSCTAAGSYRRRG